MTFRKFICTLLLVSTCVHISAKTPKQTLLFVGSYTNEKPDKGIFVFRFDPKTGTLAKLATAENIINPSYITISPNGKYLYACCDTKMPRPGSISAFAINHQHGSLSFINKQTSGGENPVYVAVDQSNSLVITGNYSSGSISLLHANADGSLSPKVETISFKDSSILKSRQEKSHIHSTFFDPDFNFIFAPDLGGDKIRAFSLSRNKSPQLIYAPQLTVQTRPGDGPRHFAFHPNKRFGYCINELSGTVRAYKYHQGILDSIQTIFSYSKVRDAYGAADIHISPDGNYLYASNRFIGENTIAIFAIDKQSGRLKLIGHQTTFGDHPRNFTIDPSGNFLLVANMLTNNIVIFRRNQKTGLLTKIGEEISVTRPSCLQMRVYE